MSGGERGTMSLQTVNIDAALLDHSKRVVAFYYQNENTIRYICEPRYANTQERASKAIAAYYKIDSVTSYLLAGMFFKNNP